MILHWFLLIWSALSFVSSIHLVKEHQRLDEILSDFNSRESVSRFEYTITGFLGYLGLFITPIATIVCCCLLYIDYFC